MSSKKNYEPGAQETDGDGRRERRAVLRASRLPDYAAGARDVVVSPRRAQRCPAATGGAAARAVGREPTIWVPSDRRVTAAGRPAGGGKAGGAPAATGRGGGRR